MVIRKVHLIFIESGQVKNIRKLFNFLFLNANDIIFSLLCLTCWNMVLVQKHNATRGRVIRTNFIICFNVQLHSKHTALNTVFRLTTFSNGSIKKHGI